MKYINIASHKLEMRKEAAQEWRIIMNILTYIAIAIGGFVAVGSTLSITLGIFGTTWEEINA